MKKMILYIIKLYNEVVIVILCIDIGNTQIVTGVFSNSGKILYKYRIASNDKLTEDEYFVHLKTLGDFHNIAIQNIKAIVISSVVPNLTNIFLYLSKKYFDVEPLIVDSNIKLPFTFDEKMENPNQLGADRIANVVEAMYLYPNENLVVVDFGTATTFDVISDKKYVGGSILPGINLSINALFKSTSKLPRIRFDKPESILGTNTIQHINAGIYYGTIGQIKEIIFQIQKYVENPVIIMTGGLSEMISSEINIPHEIREDLNLKGLFRLYLMQSMK